YGAELKITDRIGMGHDLPLLGDVNFAVIAEAMGVPAVRVEGPDQLDRIATALARRTGPLLIDVRTATPAAH
ncbi:thiamine pyrophosphate-dependent enzyme, partial [Mycolicibacterium sp. A43C]